MNSCEKRELATHLQTNVAAINELLRAGIPLDDLEEVLDIRRSLSCSYAFKRRDAFGIDIASIGSVVRAYQAVGGDIELLEEFAALADARAADSAQLARYQSGHYTRALNQVVDLFENGRLNDERCYDIDYSDPDNPIVS